MENKIWVLGTYPYTHVHIPMHTHNIQRHIPNIRVYMDARVCAHACTHTHTRIEITSSYQYLQSQSIPTGSFLPSPTPYLYVPTSIVRTLAPNDINTCAHLLNPVMYRTDSVLLLPPSLWCVVFHLKCSRVHLFQLVFSFCPHFFIRIDLIVLF